MRDTRGYEPTHRAPRLFLADRIKRRLRGAVALPLALLVISLWS